MIDINIDHITDENLRAELYATLRVLRLVEWVGWPRACPWCENTKSEGHQIGCEVAAALSGYGTVIRSEE